jgi:hypothetical protein
MKNLVLATDKMTGLIDQKNGSARTKALLGLRGLSDSW